MIVGEELGGCCGGIPAGYSTEKLPFDFMVHLASLLGLLSALTTARWGVDGHRLICALAWERMTPTARDYVTNILAVDSFPAEFPDICVWADTVRTTVLPESKPYHSRLSPTGRGHLELHTLCDPPQLRCGPWAIRHFLKALTDSETTPQGRSEALKFLAHLVGDVHQPLHEGHEADRGGRYTRVRYHGIREPNGSRLTLHKLWDEAIPLHNHLTYPSALPLLRDSIAPAEAQSWEQDPLSTWIREGEALADSVAYRLPPRHQITPAYERKAMGVIMEQMQKAAVRLAYLLNHVADGTFDRRAFEAM